MILRAKLKIDSIWYTENEPWICPNEGVKQL